MSQPTVPPISYVVVSDLHFGAQNSVLTSVSGAGSAGSDYTTDDRTPSPVLVGLVEGLRRLTAGQEHRPRLILAGDILDLALSPDEVAASVFSGFAKLAFGPDADGHALFDSVVYYLPGNHDHHLWETAREDQYIDYIGGVAASDDLVPPWHTTAMRPQEEHPAVGSHLLTTLIRRQPGCQGVDVRVIYPNMVLTRPDNPRSVVVSHGHFTESIYTLMTKLKDILYPGQEKAGPADIDKWESENFAWIDFFWSTLGRSGQVGSDVGLVYAGLTSAEVMDELAGNLARAMLAKGKGPAWLHPIETRLVSAIFKKEANHVARSERGNPDVALDAGGHAGLLAYLEGPLLNQMRGELGPITEEVTFVFGHTHKPFVERVKAVGYPSPVQVLNTGGWVVDTSVAAPVQGGVVVLVDEDLNAVPVEIYRQSTDGAPTPVRVLPAAPGDPGANPLRAALQGAIDPDREPWRSLSAAAAAEVGERHRLQAALMIEPGS